MIRRTRVLLTIVPIAASMLGARPARANEPPEELRQADEAFRAGRFAAAQTAYAAVLAKDAAQTDALLRLGELALFGNRLDEAERHLKRALDLLPDDSRPKSLLAETYYRRDDFAHAAPLFRAAGSAGKGDQLDSFKGTTPYAIAEAADTTHVRFVQTDPLPIVRARINGGEEVNLLIDTGGPELILDAEYALQIGAAQYAGATGTFAGGRQASVSPGRIDSIGLGDLTIKNVPITLMRLRLSQPGEPIRGVIGTVFLYHFVATLDYPAGELALRRRTAQSAAVLDKLAAAPGTHAVPFWMSGRHWILAWGNVNDRVECLMHVDTGMAGGGFGCPESTLKAAGIDLAGQPSFQAMGGGGPVQVTPFTVERLALGDARQSNVRALFGGASPDSEYAMGFRIGGRISHGFFRPYALTFDFERMRLLLAGPR